MNISKVTLISVMAGKFLECWAIQRNMKTNYRVLVTSIQVIIII